MQTGKTTPIRRAAVRDTSVSWHHEGLLKPLGPSQQYRIEVFEVSPQWSPHYAERRKSLGIMCAP